MKTQTNQLLRVFAVGATLGIAVFASYTGWRYHERQKYEIIRVGGRGYSDKKELITYDLRTCVSAVFDYWTNHPAEMIHAVPSVACEIDSNGEARINSDKVIPIEQLASYFIEESRKRNLNASEAGIFLSTPDEFMLQYLRQDFKKKGIKIREGKARFKGKIEAVNSPDEFVAVFDPSSITNRELHIFRIKDFPEYRMFWEVR